MEKNLAMKGMKKLLRDLLHALQMAEGVAEKAC